jgi:hypothetical protein
VVHDAIKALPSDNPPRPDGSHVHSKNVNWLNSANIVLLQKKDGVESFTDFRHISLIHVVAKIVAKTINKIETFHKLSPVTHAVPP